VCVCVCVCVWARARVRVCVCCLAVAIFRPFRMHTVHRYSLLLTVFRGLCFFVCMSCTEMAEPTEMPFGMWTWMGQKNRAFRWGHESI